MTRTPSSRARWTLRALLVASVYWGAYPMQVKGQELPWLSGGQVRLDFAPSFWTWDSRYGMGPDGSDEGVLLGSALTSDAFGSQIIPGLAALDAALGAALDDPSYRVNLGMSRAFIDQSRLVMPFHLEFGITDWLTIGGMVPLVRPRLEMTFGLYADSSTATEGVSPFATNATAVIAFLDVFRTVLQEAEASHPGETAVTEARTYFEALNLAYTHGTFFPVVGSAPGIQLQDRLEELGSGLSELGVSGLPATVPLAQGYLTDEEFGAFLNGSYMRAYPLEDWTTAWAIGDVELTADVRLLRRGFEPDSAGVFPSFRFQVGGGFLVRLGTGEQDDPLRFFDQNIGDGQMDLEGSVFGMLEWGNRLGAWGRARYGVQTEGDRVDRIASPSFALPEYGRIAPVIWDPGDYMEVEVNPRVFLTPEMSFGVRYRYWSKGEDSYTLGAIDPDFVDPALLPPANLLNQETEQTLQEVGFSATYSTVGADARRAGAMPLYVRATYYHPLSGSGAQTPKGGRFEAGLTIFKTLWGGPDRQRESPEEPVGG